MQACESFGCKDPSYSTVEKTVHSLGAAMGRGETRYAIVFRKYGVVFKFACHEDYYEDYCALEVKNYELAKKYGVERIVLPIELVGVTSHGLAVYIQPMYTTAQSGLPAVVETSYSRKTNVSKQFARKIQDNAFDGYRLSILWLRRATQIYGKKFMRRFEEWTHEAEVNDLHSNNVGYLRKQPIIIDYAGYHG